jgi:hypothetical protein
MSRALWFLFGLVAISLVIFLIWATSDFLGFERSQSTQNHGIRAVGVITSLTNSTECNRGDCNPSAAARVRLEPPTHGRSTSTIHASGKLTLGDGSVTPVLLDPQDLAYAEIPGDPLHQLPDMFYPLGLFIILLGVTASSVIVVRRKRMSQSP